MFCAHFVYLRNNAPNRYIIGTFNMGWKDFSMFTPLTVRDRIC